jgi:cobalt-zinc-cadmium efflux system membrane fusion protein
MGWAGLLAGCLIAAPAWASDVVRLNAASVQRAGVVTGEIEEQTFETRVNVFGEVVRAPGTTVTVATPVAGRVLELIVTPGELALKDEPLLLLHSHEVHEMEGAFLRLGEEMRLARSRWQAGQELFELQGISGQELDRRKQESLAAEIAFEQARHELEDLGFSDTELASLRERMEPSGRLTLRAPSDGVVLETSVEQYDWTQGFEPLLVLGQPDQLELRVRLQPAEAAHVGYGDRIEFIPVGQRGARGQARVLTPIPKVDPLSRTVAIRAEILASDAPLLPGMFVDGVLTHSGSSRALSVPVSAVIRIGDGDVVFVSGHDENTFEPRPVRLGRFNEERYEILDGLDSGERIVVEGVFLLKSAWLAGEEAD